jgi:hypothetical protein
VTAVDASAAALAVARGNAARHGVSVRFLQGDWFAPLAGERFDLILANPPYVAEADPHLAQGDVRFEPRSALAAGADGLDDIRRIVAAGAGASCARRLALLRARLRPGGGGGCAAGRGRLHRHRTTARSGRHPARLGRPAPLTVPGTKR